MADDARGRLASLIRNLRTPDSIGRHTDDATFASCILSWLAEPEQVDAMSHGIEAMDSGWHPGTDGHTGDYWSDAARAAIGGAAKIEDRSGRRRRGADDANRGNAAAGRAIVGAERGYPAPLAARGDRREVDRRGVRRGVDR